MADSGRVSMISTRSPTPALFVLVVGLELDVAAQHLAVEGVLDAVLDVDDDGLVHLVADDEALTDLAGGASSPCSVTVVSFLSLMLSTASMMPSSRSRITV